MRFAALLPAVLVASSLLGGCFDFKSPTSPTTASAQASRLVGTWSYMTLTFVDPGGSNLDASGDVGGKLTFYADGTYHQTLTIGTFLNEYRGTYVVSGDRLTTTTTDGGKTITTPHTFAIAGARLTLIAEEPSGKKTYYGLALEGSEAVYGSSGR